MFGNTWVIILLVILILLSLFFLFLLYTTLKDYKTNKTYLKSISKIFFKSKTTIIVITIFYALTFGLAMGISSSNYRLRSSVNDQFVTNHIFQSYIQTNDMEYVSSSSTTSYVSPYLYTIAYGATPQTKETQNGQQYWILNQTTNPTATPTYEWVNYNQIPENSLETAISYNETYSSSTNTFDGSWWANTGEMVYSNVQNYLTLQIFNQINEPNSKQLLPDQTYDANGNLVWNEQRIYLSSNSPLVNSQSSLFVSTSNLNLNSQGNYYLENTIKANTSTKYLGNDNIIVNNPIIVTGSLSNMLTYNPYNNQDSNVIPVAVSQVWMNKNNYSINQQFDEIVNGNNYQLKIVAGVEIPNYIFPMQSQFNPIINTKEQNVIMINPLEYNYMIGNQGETTIFYGFTNIYNQINRAINYNNQSIRSEIETYNNNIISTIEGTYSSSNQNSISGAPPSPTNFKIPNSDYVWSISTLESARAGVPLTQISLSLKINTLLTSIFIIITIFVLMLLIIKRIKDFSKQIGTMKAMGINSHKISTAFITFPILFVVFGGTLAIGLAFIIQTFYLQHMINSLSVILPGMTLSPLGVVIGIIIPLLVLVFVSYIVSRWILSKPTLDLLSNKANQKPNILVKSSSIITRKIKSFKIKYSTQRGLKNTGKSSLILFAIIASVFLMIFSLSTRNMVTYAAESANQMFTADYYEGIQLPSTNSFEYNIANGANNSRYSNEASSTSYTFGITSSIITTMVANTQNANPASNFNLFSYYTVQYMTTTPVVEWTPSPTNSYNIENFSYSYVSPKTLQNLLIALGLVYAPFFNTSELDMKKVNNIIYFINNKKLPEDVIWTPSLESIKETFTNIKNAFNKTEFLNDTDNNSMVEAAYSNTPPPSTTTNPTMNTIAPLANGQSTPQQEVSTTDFNKLFVNYLLNWISTYFLIGGERYNIVNPTTTFNNWSNENRLYIQSSEPLGVTFNTLIYDSNNSGLMNYVDVFVPGESTHRLYSIQNSTIFENILTVPQNDNSVYNSIYNQSFCKGSNDCTAIPVVVDSQIASENNLSVGSRENVTLTRPFSSTDIPINNQANIEIEVVGIYQSPYKIGFTTYNPYVEYYYETNYPNNTNPFDGWNQMLVKYTSSLNSKQPALLSSFKTYGTLQSNRISMNTLSLTTSETSPYTYGSYLLNPSGVGNYKPVNANAPPTNLNPTGTIEYNGKIYQNNISPLSDASQATTMIISKNFIVQQSQQVYNVIMQFLIVFAIFALLIGFALIMISLKEIIDSSKKEIALLKTLGYTNTKATTMVIMPYLFILLIGFLIAVPISLFGLSMLSGVLTATFQVNLPLGMLWYQWVMVGIIIILLMSLFYLFSLLGFKRTSPLEALNNAEE